MTAPMGAIHRFKAWLEAFALRPHATLALFSCAFVEASFFPLPPDVLLIALGVMRPRKAIFFSLLAVAGSTIGALVGYAIGRTFFDFIGSQLVDSLGVTAEFRAVLSQYQGNAWLVLLLAGFTFIPFMLFTIAAGFNATVAPGTLLVAVLCGRLLRFVPIGVLLRTFGPAVKLYFDRYLERAVLVTGVVVIAFLLLTRLAF